MPQYGITSGLPEAPVGLDEKSFKMLAPLYSALNAMARQVAFLSGSVTYEQTELSKRNPFGSLGSQNLQAVYAKASADIGYGKLVNLYLDGTELKMRLADSTDTTKPAHGVLDSIFGAVAGDYGKVLMMQGLTGGISGTAVGTFYWLGALGTAQSSPPAGTGHLRQAVGVGLGTAGFYLSIASQLQVT